MLFWQILIDGFAISALYALGATGFTLIFGVSGVLNLSHGSLMVDRGGGGVGGQSASYNATPICLAQLIGVAGRASPCRFSTYLRHAVRPLQRSKLHRRGRRSRRSLSSHRPCCGAS